jgi:hypothetical protein
MHKVPIICRDCNLSALGLYPSKTSPYKKTKDGIANPVIPADNNPMQRIILSDFDAKVRSF